MNTSEELQKQLEELIENPENIQDEWSAGRGLFAFVGNPDEDSVTKSGSSWDITPGCLTQIKSISHYGAFINGEYDEVLTDQIRNDERIPEYSGDITIENLPVFKEWQEKVIALQSQPGEESDGQIEEEIREMK